MEHILKVGLILVLSTAVAVAFDAAFTHLFLEDNDKDP